MMTMNQAAPTPVREDSKAQMSRVKLELLELRGRGTVNNQRSKFKDCKFDISEKD